jgi:hypothetical protein
MSDTSRLLEIEKLLAQEELELEQAGKVAEEIIPVLDTLTKKDIMNPVILKTKLAKIDIEYRNIIYALLRVAVDAGPEGSFVILDPRKISSFIKEN